MNENKKVYPLILSKRFINFLDKIDDKISNMLIRISKEKKLNFEETYIDRTDKNDTVTFIKSDKIKELKTIDEYWSSHQRIEIKIGRLINKLIGKKVNPQDIENFVNDYKALIDAKKLNKNFKIYEGEELKKWYSQDNYSVGGGNLNNSCMKYRYCQSFLDIYVKNPTKIKLLVLLDDTKEKILGRSLLWYLDRPKGKILMDRVYFTNDFIFNMFINYAIKNNFLYKIENMNNVMQAVYAHKIIRTTMLVNIKKLNYEFFPYVDNLGFYDPVNSILANDPKYLKSIGCEKYYDLCDTSGGYELRDDFDF